MITYDTAEVLLAKWDEESLPTRLLFTIFIGVTEEQDLVGRCPELHYAISSGKPYKN
ncbi:MAG: hypothetical protein WCA39_10695 [Nitrososphaeraceae archaeon]